MSRFNKTLAATAFAAAFVAATPAHAAIELDNLGTLGSNSFAVSDAADRSVGGIGELFVSIVARDLTAPAGGNDRSYVRDLGITARTFVDALRDGSIGTLAFSIDPDALLTSFLTDNASREISFNITAVHNISGYDPTSFQSVDVGMLTTSSASADTTAASGPGNLAEYSTPTATVKAFINGVNLKTDGASPGNPAQNLAATFLPGENGFHDNNFGGSSTFGFDTEGSLGGAVAFYFLSAQNGGSNLELLGDWSLLNNGTLEFSTSVQPIPLPAAAWVFVPAFACLAGRRRRQSTR